MYICTFYIRKRHTRASPGYLTCISIRSLNNHPSNPPKYKIVLIEYIYNRSCFIIDRLRSMSRTLSRPLSIRWFRYPGQRMVAVSVRVTGITGRSLDVVANKTFGIVDISLVPIFFCRAGLDFTNPGRAMVARCDGIKLYIRHQNRVWPGVGRDACRRFCLFRWFMKHGGDTKHNNSRARPSQPRLSSVK